MDYYLDPEIERLLEDAPLFNFESSEELQKIRDAIKALTPVPIPSTVEVKTLTATDAESGRSVDLVVYRPSMPTFSPRPCIYWVHGGGYVMGTPELTARQLAEWLDDLGCCVVSVDYRLAPEAPFPAALHDAVLGLEWVIAHADELQVDLGALALSGASAGAGLCAALAAEIRGRPGLAPLLQVLYFPMLDDRMITPSSAWNTPVWGRQANTWAWKSYLGEEHPDRFTARAAPGRARAADLAGLPPTFIAVGSADMFVHENLAYATELLAAGVPTELHVYPGAPHGFNSMFPQSTLGHQANRDARQALRRAFANARL